MSAADPRPTSPPVEAPEKLDEETERMVAELEDMAIQVYAALGHHRAAALRQRIRTLVSEAQREGYRMRMNDMRISPND